MNDKNDTAEQSGLSRRDVLRRGAVVGGALVWTTPVVQSLAGPAFAQTVGSTRIDQDTIGCGRITGGGLAAALATDGRRVTYGIGQLFCGVVNFTANLTQLTINYTVGTTTVVFKLNTYTSTCSGDGALAGAPATNFNTLDLTGAGTVGPEGTVGLAATIMATFVDNGEAAGSGAGVDQVKFTITVAGNTAFNLTVALGPVVNGNIQAHKAAGNMKLVCGEPLPAP